MFASASAAVARLTAACRRAIGAGVRCNAVLPGLIRTPLVTGMLRAATPGISDAELESAFAERDAASPTGEMGRAEDVAKLVAYLLSDDAACAPLPLPPALASSGLFTWLVWWRFGVLHFTVAVPVSVRRERAAD